MTITNHWLSGDHNIFSKMAPHRIANMNEDTGKFAYDSLKQRTKKDKNCERDLTKNLQDKVFNF